MNITLDQQDSPDKLICPVCSDTEDINITTFTKKSQEIINYRCGNCGYKWKQTANLDS